MERGLVNKYGTRVTLYFKQNNISYKIMHRFIYREARTVPNLLMVDCKSELEYRKWATFYMDRERADLLAMALTVDSKLRKMFGIRFSDRMGERVMPGGRDWNPLMPDAKVTLNYDDKLELVFEQQIQAMKGDLIATAINTDFLSKVDSSKGSKSTRHDPVKRRKVERNKIYTWECLDDVKMSSKTWETSN